MPNNFIFHRRIHFYYKYLFHYKKGNGATQNLAPQPVLAKNEIDLLNDWDTFKSDEAAYDNSDILSSSDDTPDNSSLENNNNNNNKPINNQRPDTRLGFNTNTTEMENNSYSASTSANEYSDNITVRSSASSLKQFQDMNSECVSECSLLISPRNNGPFEYYKRDSHPNANYSHTATTNHINKNTTAYSANNGGTNKYHLGPNNDPNGKRPESQQSVLSDFISNLHFEDNANRNNKNNNNFEDDYSNNQVHLVGKLNILFIDVQRISLVSLELKYY